MFRPFRFSALLPVLLAFFACKPGNNGTEDTFDRGLFLQDVTNNLIRPAYSQLSTQTTALHEAALFFAEAPDTARLQSLRNAWNAAYSDWQFANAYNFGPSGEEGLRKGLIEEVGTFPASISKIEAAVQAGTWNMTDFNRDARGFLTIDYLIFGSAASSVAISNQFVADAQRRAFLTAVTANIRDRVAEVSNAWNGAYGQEFLADKGTSVGSSTALFYNEFVRSFESVKNFKLGLPMGKRPGQTTTEPQLVEAYYSGQSLEFTRLHLTAIENIWYGKSKSGQDGIGFREYLEKVEGGPALITGTEAQLAAVRTALNAVPASPALSDQIIAGSPALENLYTEIQKLTRYYKSDLSSLLGIAITFSSGDGD